MAFPDLAGEFTELIAEGDRVAYFREDQGTHEGTFRGIGPTGEQLTFEYGGYFVIDDGTIVYGNALGSIMSLLNRWASTSRFRPTEWPVRAGTPIVRPPPSCSGNRLVDRDPRSTTMSSTDTSLEELIERATTDVGAIAYAPLAVIGDRLGLYDALAEHGPLTPSELAGHTDTAERYVREWLAASAASEYVRYDAEAERYDLSAEQALLLADTGGPPPSLAGLFQTAVAAGQALPRLEDAFRTGDGVGWHDHDEGVSHGMSRISEFGFEANLVSDWIPALDGVDETLEAGGRVADVGCGHGASTVIMAEAYPNSTFVGVDYHEASIEAARERAAEAGVTDRVTFEVALAQEYGGGPFDFVTTFDCLHDMGDPVGVAEHVRETLAADGTWMIVEPLAGDSVTANLNPRGRLFYSMSTMVCTPNAIDQDGPHALGAQAGEGRLRDVVTEAGFTRFRRATETPPFDMVLEAKP